jgi:hypothetical protein
MKKKLVIIILSALLLVGIAGTVGGASIAEAASSIWNSCVRNRVNCPYPGACNSYIDTNKDRICDRSQSAPLATTSATPVKTTPASTATASTTTTSANTAGTSVTVTTTPTPTLAAATSPTTQAAQEIATTGEVAENISGRNRSYYFIPILAVIGLLYVTTWVLAARKIVKNVIHRRIWNIVLLVAMAISAILGILLILSIDFNINVTLPFNMLFWHVEAGIALGIVGLFHILWHRRYFVKIFQHE